MLYHPDYVPERWQIFIAFLIIQWLTCALVLFGQRILPIVFNIMGVLSLVFWFVTLMVVAIMPSTHGNGYASTAFVWRDWENLTGYSSDGFVFLAGMLNGAYALGTIDSVAHSKSRNLGSLPSIIQCNAGNVLTDRTHHLCSR